jgi:hypothetical protein
VSLTDPQPALAEASTFIDYLVGLAGLGRLVRALATDAEITTGVADDFVQLLVGIAGVAAGVERLAVSQAGAAHPCERAAPTASGRWLR